MVLIVWDLIPVSRVELNERATSVVFRDPTERPMWVSPIRAHRLGRTS